MRRRSRSTIPGSPVHHDGRGSGYSGDQLTMNQSQPNEGVRDRNSVANGCEDYEEYLAAQGPSMCDNTLNHTSGDDNCHSLDVSLGAALNFGENSEKKYVSVISHMELPPLSVNVSNYKTL
ncbi:hypothetical protein QAD02_000504 [Eretmocerus hayati]|uniref:Uncharacterized protein n=1 Tax=Eretmocerus hayati TaxID=131215 RepID=A0ACC2NDL6_9HYME|nr:hypothetical protein QAD02_000504 [Eretmocerus hayati]